MTKNVYYREDVPADRDCEKPGKPPYTRGIRPLMYASRPWTVRQYAGFSTAEESNRFYHQCLEGGQTGLSVAFDLATHRGFDSDHPRVAADVGKAGVAIDSVEDMKRLFEGIALDTISVSMTMNGAVIPVLAMFILAGEEQGVGRNALSGTIQNDILKEFMVRNTFIYPPVPSMRIVADIIAFVSRDMPKFNSVSISGYHMQEAGASLAQELACTLANGREYVRTAKARGLDIDHFAGRLSFFFGIGTNFLAEVAKLRAARRMWARIMRGEGARQDRSLMARIHCQTSGVSLTARGVHNNIVRTAIEALAAVLGGTQSLHTNAFDEALALPGDEAARIARDTQLVLRHECGLADIVDPLGGSYCIEALTDQLEQEAGHLIDEIDAAGGMLAALKAGLPQDMIEREAVRHQAELERGQRIVVGVNKYRHEDEARIDIRQIDNSRVRAGQCARLVELRARRDNRRCAAALSDLTEAARDDSANLLDYAIEAARQRATLGEISSAMENVFGRHEKPARSVSGVMAAAFEHDGEFRAIARKLSEYRVHHGRPPCILMAKMGQDGHDRGLKVVAAGFSDLGFQVEFTDLFRTADEVADHAVDVNADIIGVSSLAAGHRDLVAELAAGLRARHRTDIMIVCGGVIPPGDHDDLKALGVAAIFGPATPVLEAAATILNRLDGRRSNM